MDDSSHVFLIKDKIRCIQKKIMDQLAADLNSALNDANILSSSLSTTAIASSSSATISKIKRRRKRPTNNDMQQQPSDSTTPENNRSRNNSNKQTIVSDSDEILMPSRTQSSTLAAASESDSASQTDDIRRRRRPFKKPIIPPTLPLISKSEQHFRLTRCPTTKLSTSVISTPLRRRRRNCRSESHSGVLDIDDGPSTPSSSSSFSLAINTNDFAGKRKRSRTIVHDDFRLRNNSLHDYDMACVDESHLTNISSSSSLNLSDSDKEPCLTSNEADDEQSDWPRDESSVPRVISWWEDEKSDNDEDDDDDDNDEKMLTTTDGTLQKIVNGALSMMLANSKNTLRNKIKTYVHREMLTGNRKNLGSKNAYTHPHPKRHIRLLKEARRSHHHSYSHKRVKNDHYSHKHNEIVAPIDSTNIGHQLLEKIGWTPGNGLGINQHGITAPVQINYRNCRQGLGYENTPMDTGERMESEQSPSISSHPSHV